MITEEYLKNYFLTKENTIKSYLLGNEDKLFLTKEDDHIKNVFSSNKKESRMLFYRVNYFIAVLILLIVLIIFIPQLFSSFSNLLGVLGVLLLLTFTVFLKPIVHLFALKNKRSKKNIYLYKELYGEDNFKKLAEVPESKVKWISKLLIIGIGIVAFLSFNILSLFLVNIEKAPVETEINIVPEKVNSSIIEKEETKKMQSIKPKASNPNTAIVTGTDIIMRKGHSTKFKIVGSFKDAGEKVVLLDTYTSEQQTVLIKNKVTVTDRNGIENILPKGKSIKVVAVNEEPPIEVLISFVSKKGKTEEGMVSENDLDYINESWYKVKRDSGEIGWVFGKFIKMI